MISLKLVSVRSIFALFYCLLLVAGCAQKGVQGVWFPSSQIAQLKPGEHNRDQIFALLGPPNFVNPYRPHIMYYYGARTKQVGKFPPRLKDRQVLILRFDLNDDRLQALELRDVNSVRHVRIASKKTKGLPKSKKGFFGDIFGNIGEVGLSGGK